jgi:hypothetical protein
MINYQTIFETDVVYGLIEAAFKNQNSLNCLVSYIRHAT